MYIIICLVIESSCDMLCSSITKTKEKEMKNKIKSREIDEMKMKINIKSKGLEYIP